MKKLLLISNPSVLGKNLENILKQNYHTDFISTVPKQIGSIPLTLIMLCSWISHCYMNIVLSYVRLQKSTSQILLFCFYALPIFQNKLFWISMKQVPMTIIFDPLITSTFTEKLISYLVTIIQPQSMKTAT